MGRIPAMRPVDRIAEWTTRRRAITIVVMLVLTGAIGIGAGFIDEQTGLGQFETDSPEADKLEFINDHFGLVDDERTTAVQIIISDDNALSRESLISTIELQKDFRDDPLVNETLATDPFADVSSTIATIIYRENLAEDLADDQQSLEGDLEAVNETADTLVELLDETRDLQQAYDELNASFAAGDIDRETYDEEAQAIEAAFADVTDRGEVVLEGPEVSAFEAVTVDVRSIQQALFETEVAYQQGEIDRTERDTQMSSLGEDMEAAYERIWTDILADRYETLEEKGEALGERADAIPTAEPSLAEQRTAIEEVDEERLEKLIDDLFTDPRTRGLLGLMPTDYDPGSPQSDMRAISVAQLVDDDMVGAGEAPDRVIESQLRMAEIVEERYGDDGFVFGQGIITDELNRSLNDSLALVIPFALLFVIVALLIAYRDLLDIILGVAGIITVLVWTFGFMGWAGIEFNQVFVAVPVLLIGLSIDYAIHVFMRQREQRQLAANRSSGRAMKIALGGLLVALTWVTATAVFGFLSNLISPVDPIREFGLVSAFGIASALLIFGLLIPATKVTLDNVLEARGFDRRRRAFGTGGGRFSGVLSLGQVFARRGPWVVIVVALLVTAGGAYGASQVDTSFEIDDFLADAPPEWTDHLPETIRPSGYVAKANMQIVDDRFLREDLQAEVLIEGDITEARTLERLDAAINLAGEQPATVRLADGEPDVHSPLAVMNAVAAENATFNETFHNADTTGDGVPDQNLEAVYDALFDADPARAADVLYRTDDGDYRAMRMVVSLRGEATADEVINQMRTVAASVDGDGLEATATGQVVVFSIIEDEIFDAVFESLIVSLISVFLFLMIVYRITDGSALLGVVTLAPILLAVAWILGTMYLLDMPFNVVTGTITSLTIGLGVAYNIHMSERFRLELARGRDVWDALYVSVTGTGGALLGSAATTAGGFGVLAIAIIPVLQQFGVITAITIIYAFLGSLLVLPSLLVLWVTYFGPAVRFKTTATRRLRRTYTEPGETTSVTVNIEAPAGPVILREAATGSIVEAERADPPPLDLVPMDGEMYAIWELDDPTTCTVTYRVRIPEDASIVELDGSVETATKTLDVEGQHAVEVVDDAIARVLTNQRPTLTDLRRAGEAARRGAITRAQLETVYERWLARFSGEQPVPALTEADEAFEWLDEPED